MRDGVSSPRAATSSSVATTADELRAAGALERAHHAAGLVVGGAADVVGRLVDRARGQQRGQLAGHRALALLRGEGAGLRGGASGADGRGSWRRARVSRGCGCTRPSLPITSTGAACALSAARLHTRATTTQYAIRNMAMTPMLGSPRRATPPCNAPCAHPPRRAASQGDLDDAHPPAHAAAPPRRPPDARRRRLRRWRRGRRRWRGGRREHRRQRAPRADLLRLQEGRLGQGRPQAATSRPRAARPRSCRAR